MTIQQDFQKISPVPEQIWKNEYALPNEFYSSSSSKTLHLSDYTVTREILLYKIIDKRNGSEWNALIFSKEFSSYCKKKMLPLLDIYPFHF